MIYRGRARPGDVMDIFQVHFSYTVKKVRGFPVPGRDNTNILAGDGKTANLFRVYFLPFVTIIKKHTFCAPEVYTLTCKVENISLFQDNELDSLIMGDGSCPPAIVQNT